MHGETTTNVVHGLLAEFASPEALLTAAQAMREAGHQQYDCHSPFPIHGMDKAMGLPPSKVGWIVLTFGATGLAIGMGLQWWAATIAYPLVISGKPLFSYQAFVPIAFEVTVLLSSFGAVLGMLGLSRLPRFYHPLFNSKKFRKVTDDGFFISLPATDPKFNEQENKTLLNALGATNVEVIEL